MPLPKANHSRHKDPMRLGRHRLAIFKTIGDHAKRQCLGLDPRLLLGRRIDEHTGQRRHFADPAAIILTLNLDPHAATPQTVQYI
jgi:hypothetical protein